MQFQRCSIKLVMEFWLHIPIRVEWAGEQLSKINMLRPLFRTNREAVLFFLKVKYRHPCPVQEVRWKRQVFQWLNFSNSPKSPSLFIMAILFRKNPMPIPDRMAGGCGWKWQNCGATALINTAAMLRWFTCPN